MKEFKGTPGPWSINHYYNWIESENADKVVIGGSQGYRPDDAQLIAAAPELLEALQELISGYEDREQSGMFDMLVHGDLIEKANAAINKALGE